MVIGERERFSVFVNVFDPDVINPESILDISWHSISRSMNRVSSK